MKLLLIDIETAPNVAHVWGMYRQNISPKHLLATGYTMCWAAKWYKKRGIMFDSINKSSAEEMTLGAWNLLNEADAVIHYNGARFDVPTLNKEFLVHGLLPPEPYKQIDLLKTMRNQFRFHSNKLDEVLKRLKMTAKVEHKGIELWQECMNNDDKAWAQMERYNKRDVKIMEDLYTRLLPWIKGHPNYGVYVDSDRPVCCKCGSRVLTKQGFKRTKTQVYQQYQCKKCGSWNSERINSTPTNVHKNALVESS